MNCITILTTNVILIGDTEVTDTGVTIQKPYSIQKANGEEFVMTPFLQAHIGQEVETLDLKSEHILCSVECEKNDLLDGYLKQISGIVLEDKKIVF